MGCSGGRRGGPPCVPRRPGGWVPAAGGSGTGRVLAQTRSPLGRAGRRVVSQGGNSAWGSSGVEAHVWVGKRSSRGETRGPFRQDPPDYALGGASPYVLYGLADATGAVDLAAPGSHNGYKVNPPSNGPAGLATVASTPDLNGADQPDLLFSYRAGRPMGTRQTARPTPCWARPGRINHRGPSTSPTASPVKLGSLIAGGANADSAGSSLAGIESGSDYDTGYVIGAPNAGNRARSQSGSAYVESGATLSGSSAAAARASDPGSDRTRTNCYPHSLPAYCSARRRRTRRSPDPARPRATDAAAAENTHKPAALTPMPACLTKVTSRQSTHSPSSLKASPIPSTIRPVG